MEGFESWKTENATITTKQTQSYTCVPEKEDDKQQIVLEIIKEISSRPRENNGRNNQTVSPNWRKNTSPTK